MTEIIDRFVVDDIKQGKLPPYWDNKPVVQGLYQAIKNNMQVYFDTVKAWADGTTISNAVGNNLDDWGDKYNLPRQGREDEEYRLAILLKMAAYSDSGTTTDVLRFVRSSFEATFADITQYPDTRFGTMRVEGAMITVDGAASINQKVTSGSRLDITFDKTGYSFVPACLVLTSPPQELLAVLPPSGATDTITLQLEAGMVDTLGYVVEDTKTIYPAGKERATLSVGNQALQTIIDTDGNPIELITDSGPVPVEVLIDYVFGGRVLASLPVTKI